MMDVEPIARQVCVGEFSSFHITMNDHKSNYQTAEQAIKENFNGWYDDDNFVSPDEKQRCIKTNTIWSVQWYPDTPVGSYKVMASTLEACLAEVASGRRG